MNQDNEINLVDLFWRCVSGWRKMLALMIIFAVAACGLNYARICKNSEVSIEKPNATAVITTSNGSETEEIEITEFASELIENGYTADELYRMSKVIDYDIENLSYDQQVIAGTYIKMIDIMDGYNDNPVLNDEGEIGDSGFTPYELSEFITSLRGFMSGDAMRAVNKLKEEAVTPLKEDQITEVNRSELFIDDKIASASTETAEKPGLKELISIKWIVVGLILGIFASFCIDVVCMIFGGRLMSAEEFHQRYRVRELGVLHKQPKNVIDRCIYSAKNKNCRMDNEAVLKSAVNDIVIMAEQNGFSSIKITGTEKPDEERLSEFASMLKKNGVECIYAEDTGLVGKEKVIVWESAYRSLIGKISNEFETFKAHESDVLGFILEDYPLKG